MPTPGQTVPEQVVRASTPPFAADAAPSRQLVGQQASGSLTVPVFRWGSGGLVVLLPEAPNTSPSCRAPEILSDCCLLLLLAARPTTLAPHFTTSHHLATTSSTLASRPSSLHRGDRGPRIAAPSILFCARTPGPLTFVGCWAVVGGGAEQQGARRGNLFVGFCFWFRVSAWFCSARWRPHSYRHTPPPPTTTATT